MDRARIEERVRTLAADRLTALVGLIALGTLGAGLFQLAFPGVILDIIDGSDSTTAKHFFAIVGMFMALFGALTLHSLWTGQAVRMVVGWGAIQKLGASIAVGAGVANDVFGNLALLVAGFDAVSFIVMSILAKRSQ
jgi:hypothetical protein